MPQDAPKIMIVAGEASGDMHGAGLAREIKKLVPDARLFGMGGSGMRAAGVETLVDISGVAVVGISEVLAHFREIKSAFDRLRTALYEDKPKLIVLIDYPDFNLRLAKEAKKAGVGVVYYVSPQVWAWRRGRIKTIARLVDRMLVLFPFEADMYKAAGVDAVFVGHPLLDTPAESRSRNELADAFGLDASRPIVGLLPGSRRKELAYHLPAMLGAYRVMKAAMPGLQAVVPVADTLTPADFAPYMAGYDDVRLAGGDPDGVMALMDAGVVASGTATLQVALHGKPMVIIYRLSPVTYALGRLLIRVKNIGLANLVLGYEAAPELIQGRATPGNISALLSRMICDKAYGEAMGGKLGTVRGRLGGPGASQRAAMEVVRLLNQWTL